MNLETVLKCAQIAADHRRAALGFVDDDIVELLAELQPAAEAAPVEVPAKVPAEAEPEAPAAE